jgi:hypothetical protein
MPAAAVCSRAIVGKVVCLVIFHLPGIEHEDDLEPLRSEGSQRVMVAV